MSDHADSAMYGWSRCTHRGIGQPGCPMCDPDRDRVAARATFVARRGLYTRAEVLAFGERVRAECLDAVDGIASDYDGVLLEDPRTVVNAVDVARLLDSGD